MADFDYRSAADQAATQKSIAQNQAVSSLFRALMQGRQQQALQQQQYALKQQGQDSDIQKLADMAHSGIIPEGGGAKVGDVSFQRGYNMQALARQQNAANAAEASKLSNLGKSITPYEDALETNRRFQESLDLGTVAGDKNAAINAARLGEGAKARLQQAMIEEFMKQGKSPDQAATEAQNYMNGTATSPMPAAVRNSMRALGFMHYQGAKRDFQAALEQAQQQAPYMAPTMTANGSIGQFTGTWGKRGAQSISDLDNRYAAYQKQGGGDVGAPVQQHQAPRPTGVMGLLSLIGGSSQTPQSSSTSSSTASNAGSPGNLSSFIGTAPTAPATAAAGGAAHPMAGRTVRDKLTGKIGTIDANGTFVPQ